MERTNLLERGNTWKQRTITHTFSTFYEQHSVNTSINDRYHSFLTTSHREVEGNHEIKNKTNVNKKTELKIMKQKGVMIS